MSSETKTPETLPLDQIREGAKRASARFEKWPAWKRQVSEEPTAPQELLSCAVLRRTGELTFRLSLTFRQVRHNFKVTLNF